jgi:hypothetical protein
MHFEGQNQPFFTIDVKLIIPGSVPYGFLSSQTLAKVAGEEHCILPDGQ